MDHMLLTQETDKEPEVTTEETRARQLLCEAAPICEAKDSTDDYCLIIF